ncbi:MAG: Gfo/Idh/MocA family oxidoreductase [Candidatus Latescibacteria bacterium]|nr:Gfo/Idh/MocA family oxidoreductase [Candidatus Latescibacterota bacterium]
MSDKTKIGIVGCGAISAAYLKIAKTFPILEVAACADMVPERARARAEEFGVPRACSVEELLRDPEIQIVVNLTIPRAHGEVGVAALEAGKSVYNEKPLAVWRADGKKMVDLAQQKGLRLGAAPDTFLGGGHQTCRKLIDDGWIGEPIGATAFILCHGHESWHPDPAFYYHHGGGPMFDMGPYYLTALVNMMGPVKRVTGMARITFPERTITSQAKYGQKVQVEVPTHVTGIMEFHNGAIGTITTSFDVWAGQVPRIEVYGTEGSLSVPDPNGFGGQVKVRRAGAADWSEVPLSHGYVENTRSIGVADMAHAQRSGRPHRASAELVYHVLDLMHAFHDASSQGQTVELGSTCQRPAPLPLGLLPGQLDA